MMSRWQAVQQLRWIAEAAAWTEGVAAKVLAPAATGKRPRGGIISSAAFDPALLDKLLPPFLFIGDAGGTPGDNHPELLTARVALTLFVDGNMGDEYGEAMSIGVHQNVDGGSSANQGMLRTLPTLVKRIINVGAETGLSVGASEETDSAPVLARPGLRRSLLAKEVVLSVPVHEREVGYYHPALYLRGSVALGVVTLLWSGPPARYDNPSAYTTIVRKSGSAPTTIADGTVVSTTAASGFTNTPGAGTWYFAAAPAYAEPGATRYATLATCGPFAG